MERAVRLELTNTRSAVGRLGRLATRARNSATDEHGFTQIEGTAYYSRSFSFPEILIRVDLCISVANFDIGTEGEIRTLESSLEDSHVSGYITSAGRISDCEMRISDLRCRSPPRLRLPIGLT